MGKTEATHDINQKDIYNKEYLGKLDFNNRQLEAFLSFKIKGKIKSSEYQKKFNVSERTARYDLAKLVERNLLVKQGHKKATVYSYADKLPLNL